MWKYEKQWKSALAAAWFTGLTWQVVGGFCCTKIGCSGATDGPGQWTSDSDGACVGVQQGGFQWTDGVKEDRRQAAGETQRA